MENFVINLKLKVVNKSFSIVILSTRLEKLGEPNQDTDIEYLVGFLLPLKFVVNVRHCERSAGFGHDEAPNTHREHITHLTEIDLTTGLVNIFVKFTLLYELIRQVLHGFECLHFLFSLFN